MTFPGREGGEIEALVTDRYLDALLAGDTWPRDLWPAADASAARRRDGLDVAVRAASRRLAEDLPRFHPSFRFEERLALRLAEAAAAMRLPLAAGDEGVVIQIPSVRPSDVDPLGVTDDGDPADPLRPLIRGAVAASALSLAGAAWFAWRHRPASSRMARAVRAAHASSGARPAPGRIWRT